MKKAETPAHIACWKPSTKTRSANASTSTIASLLARAAVIEIFVQDVKLPQVLIGIGDPELGLQSVAAFDPLFALRGDAGSFEVPLNLDQRGRIGQPQAQMIERSAARGRRRFEREHQRRIFAFELCIILPQLGRFVPKQQPVKPD